LLSRPVRSLSIMDPKSASKASAASAAAAAAAMADADEVREQDRFLPIANISRIMKKALPTNAKVSKEAKETVQECVSEFISFVTSEASDRVQTEKRKTITGDDVLFALSTLGFERYVEPLKIYLAKYRESVKGDKTGKKDDDKDDDDDDE
jgi:nuclear transcription Y subunit beta